MNHSLPIIVLAAGQSSRMRGRDKLLEIVDGVPLLRRQTEIAMQVTKGPVLVALPPAPHHRYDVLEGLGVLRVPVPDADQGMNASLRTAFAALPKDAKAAMLVLADLPDLTENDLRKVLQAYGEEGNNTIWRGATSHGAAGHPIIFAACHFAQFDQLTGDAGGREIIAAAREHTALVRLPDQHARRDLDTPEEWAAWRHENPDR